NGTVEAEVESLAHGGEGVAHVDGRVVFVAGAVPGERILARIVEEHPRWARARLEGILRPSPDRIEPRCPLHAECGGCGLQHVPSAVQRRAKAGAVADLLERVGGRRPPAPIVCEPPPREWAYRQRAVLSWRRGEEGVVMGFHRAGDPVGLVDVPACPVLDERISARLPDVRSALLGALGDEGPTANEGRLALRALPGHEVDAGVFAADPGPARWIADTLSGRGIPATWGRWDRAGLRLANGAPRRVARLTYRDLNLRVGFDSFLQVDLEGAAALYEAALELLDAVPGEAVIDAYAGIGVLACELARSGVRVTAIESHPGAASDLRANVAWAGDDVHVLEIAADRMDWWRPRPDAIVVNPPRGGCARRVIEGIARSRARRLVYVACDPATLARDVRRLGTGWHLDRVRVFDLFPQTVHVETILRLTRT
ncbi:MAG TPA: TRAM domain-containing protein, partial [Gemmatimonadota bacterium]|nr:TRAM domain-containing protein [Gemmatimonadota bacterium]